MARLTGERNLQAPPTPATHGHGAFPHVAASPIRPPGGAAVRGRGAHDGRVEGGTADGASWKGHGAGAGGVSSDLQRAPPAPVARAWSSRRAAGALAADEGLRLRQRLVADHVVHPHACILGTVRIRSRQLRTLPLRHRNEIMSPWPCSGHIKHSG